MTKNFEPAKTGRPRMSAQDYSEMKRAEKARVYQLIDETAADIVSAPEKFRSFLDTQSRMNRYSSANALLIFNQFPEAVQLKDFEDWSKEGVKIKKGAKSISILEPVEYTKKDGSTGISYNVKKVFDISQTNRRQFMEFTMEHDPKAFITEMFDTAPVKIELKDEIAGSDSPAFYDHDRKTVYVRRGAEGNVETAQCVAKEIGYAQLAEHCESFDRKDMEFEAECISYMLCKRFGINTKNLHLTKYLRSGSKRTQKKFAPNCQWSEMQCRIFVPE